MSADAFGGCVRANHHDGGVPANISADSSLEMFVTGEPRLVLGGNGVDVRSGNGCWKAHLGFAGTLEQAGQEVAGASLALYIDDGVERVEPFLGFLRIGIRKLVHGAVEQHAPILARRRARATPPLTSATASSSSGAMVPVFLLTHR